MVDLLKNKYLHNVALLSIPIILFSLSQETIPTNKCLCLFSNIFEVQCYGCGTYRAIMSFLNVEIINALNYNINILFVFPLLLYIWIKKIMAYN